MGTRTRGRALAVVAALALTCLAPTTASAASDAEDPSTSERTRAWVPNYDDAVGHATFESHGERLFACDDWADGETVSAWLEWDGNTYTVADWNGAGQGCAEAINIPNIPEGEEVRIQACAGDDCGEWVSTYT